MYAPRARSTIMDLDAVSALLNVYGYQDGPVDGPAGSSESFDYEAASASSARLSVGRSSGSNWLVSTPGSQEVGFSSIAGDALLDPATRPSSAQLSSCEGLDPNSHATVHSGRTSLDSESRPGPITPQELPHPRMSFCPHPSCSRHTRGFPRRWNLKDHLRRRHKGMPVAGADQVLHPDSTQPYPASDTDIHPQNAPLDQQPSISAFLSSSNLRHHNSAFNRVPTPVQELNGRVYGSIMLLCSLWHSFYSDFPPNRFTQQQIYEVFGLQDTDSIQLARNMFAQLYSTTSQTISDKLPPSIELHFLDTLLHVWRQINPHEELSEEKARLIGHLLRWPVDVNEILRRVPRLLGSTAGTVDLQHFVSQTREKFRNNQEACSNLHPSSHPMWEGIEGDYECTVGCGARFPRKGPWLRHEEANWRQRFWFCWKNQCCQSDPSGRVFFSEREYRTHLQAQHDELSPHQSDVDAAQVLIDSNFPRQCHVAGCEAHLATWDERNQHLESVHFGKPSTDAQSMAQQGSNDDVNPDGGGGSWASLGKLGLLSHGTFGSGTMDGQFSSDYGGATGGQNGWRMCQLSPERDELVCQERRIRSKSDACLRTKSSSDLRLRKHHGKCLEPPSSPKPLPGATKSPQLRAIYFQMSGQMIFDPTAFLTQEIMKLTL